MAKASQDDMDLAIKLYQILEAIEDKCFLPDNPDEVDDWDEFDEDNPEHLKRFHDQIMKVYKSGSLLRVVWGFLVLADPANEIIHPDSDVLELHPKLAEAFEKFTKIKELITEAMKHEAIKEATEKEIPTEG